MTRLLGPAVIEDLAVVGSDPYLREGSDLTIVFRVTSKAAFDAGLATTLMVNGADARRRHHVVGRARRRDDPARHQPRRRDPPSPRHRRRLRAAVEQPVGDRPGDRDDSKARPAPRRRARLSLHDGARRRGPRRRAGVHERSLRRRGRRPAPEDPRGAPAAGARRAVAPGLRGAALRLDVRAPTRQRRRAGDIRAAEEGGAGPRRRRAHRLDTRRRGALVVGARRGAHAAHRSPDARQGDGHRARRVQAVRRRLPELLADVHRSGRGADRVARRWGAAGDGAADPPDHRRHRLLRAVAHRRARPGGGR